MTQIITRYFEDSAQALKAKRDLVQFHRFSPRIIDLFDDAEGLSEALTAKHVDKAAADAYAKKVAKGGSVMLVSAGFRPLRAAQITRDVTAAFGGPALDGLEEESFVKDPPELGRSILTTHPHIMKTYREPGTTNFHMADWPIPLINRRKPGSTSLMDHDMRFGDFFLPLTDRRVPFSASIFPRHARMANMVLPLISKRKPFTGSIFAPHARMANFPIPLISRRRPFTGSIFPRHQRMATVPFPLLINGKTGTNALMPGGPRMANFPIRLISQRKPNTASIFPRHARMANFPIGLISRRKPSSASIFPRHARMADMFLPLVVRRGDVAAQDGGSGFSFSKMIGLHTISRRGGQDSAQR